LATNVDRVSPNIGFDNTFHQFVDDWILWMIKIRCSPVEFHYILEIFSLSK